MLRIGLLALFLASFAPRAALAQEEGPSIIGQGWSGLWAGAFVGAGGGYLVGRRDGWKKSDWRAEGLGIGIGALAGAGLGVAMGVIDKSGAPGARYVMRDMAAGSTFGAVIGLIGGGISAAINHKAEYALYGTAIGVCAGAGLGIITGVIEGLAKRREAGEPAGDNTARLRLRPSLDFVALRENSLGTAVSGIRGTF